jgi:hypothetical protein
MTSQSWQDVFTKPFRQLFSNSSHKLHVTVTYIRDTFYSSFALYFASAIAMFYLRIFISRLFCRTSLQMLPSFRFLDRTYFASDSPLPLFSALYMRFKPQNDRTNICQVYFICIKLLSIINLYELFVMIFTDWKNALHARVSAGIAHKLVAQFTGRRNPARDLDEGISFVILRTIRCLTHTRAPTTLKSSPVRTKSDHTCRRRPSGSSRHFALISSGIFISDRDFCRIDGRNVRR